MAELNPNDYTVIWLAPLEIEAQAALHMLDKRHEGQFALRRGFDCVFQAGEMCGHNIVIATLPAGQEYGTGSAAALAGQVKMFFPNLWFGLLVGVAAGLPDLSVTPPRDIRLGDVLVALGDGDSAGVIAYDLGKETSDGMKLLHRGYRLATTEAVVRSAIGSIKLSAPNDAEIIQPYYQSIRDKEHAKGTFKDPGQEWDRLYETDQNGMERCVYRPQRPDHQRTRVWYGPIGSGEKLMKNAKKRDELRDQYGIIGLEMEAAGTMNRIPVGVIRGACDYGDSHKNKEWQPYAAAMAAAYAKAILAEIRTACPTASGEGALTKEVTGTSVTERAVFMLPFPKDPCFVGRESELEHLEEMLCVEPRGLTEVAIVGLGGIGKTQVANEYAHRLQEKETREKGAHERRSIIWIHASSQARIEHDFNVIARKFRLVPDGSTNTDVFPVVKEWFEGEASGRWLLIIDNADDEDILFQPFTSKLHSFNALTGRGDGMPVVRRVCDFLPQKPNCAILYTTRHSICAQRLLQRTRSTKTMELRTMSVEDCIKVLKFELLGSTEARGPGIVTEGSYIVDEPSMERLVELLGRLPLAIIQAASFMRENSLMPSEYVSLYNDMETEHADFLNEEFVDWRRDSDMPNAVLCTWKLSFEKIKCKNELAVRMLSVLSALDSQGVSDWMLPYFPGAAKFQLTKAIALLRSFSFVSRRGNSMHRLVQVATRAWVGPDEWHSAVRDALRFLCNVFAGLNSNEWTSKGKLSYSTLRKSLEYYPHTKSIIAALSTTATSSTTPTGGNGSLSKSTFDRFLLEWNEGDLRSEDFVKKANDIYHEIITGGYQSLTDMILLVRGLSDGSRRYFYKLYKGPYGSTDTVDSYSFSPDDLGYDQVALSAAAEYGDEELVNLLIETNKINMDSTGLFNGRTPLSRASEFGHERVVELLLKTGKVDVNLSDTKGRPGRTPLLWASVRGHTTVVKLLLETGEADINATDHRYGRTALSWAAGKGHVAIVKLLLETNKARIDAPDHYNRQRPLSWASQYGHVEIVKLLLDTGKVDINSTSNGQHTPLSYAVENGHAGVVKVLLETGQVDVASLQKSWGLTPFMTAARRGHTAVVKLLLKTGQVDINAKIEPTNKTALFWAIDEKQLEVVELLRAWGATV